MAKRSAKLSQIFFVGLCTALVAIAISIVAGKYVSDVRGQLEVQVVSGEKLLEASMRLVALTSDYVVNSENRSATQWRRQSAMLDESFAEAKSNAAISLDRVDRIGNGIQRARKIFSLLADNLEGLKAAAEAEAQGKLMQTRLASELLTINHSIMSAALQAWNLELRKQTTVKDPALRDLVASVYRATAQLSSLGNDFVFNFGERAEIQWRRHLSTVRQLVGEAQSLSGKEQEFLGFLDKDIQRAEKYFSLLSKTAESATLASEEKEHEEYKRNRLASELLNVVHTLTFDVRQNWERVTQTQRDNIDQIWEVSSLITLILFSCVTLSWWSVSSYMINRVNNLRNNIVSAKEDLDHRIEVKREDEIGEVAIAFNDLSRGLSESLVSRDRLIAEIKERNIAEAKVKQLNEHLEEMVDIRTKEFIDTNEELEAFAYSVSHDLRAPLRAIDGFSQALVEDCEESISSEGKTYVKHLRDGAQEMSSLIDQVLILSRSTRGEVKREAVNMSNMAEEILQGFSEAEPERALRFHVEPDCQAMADPSLIRTVLENLLENSWKFTRNKDEAVIEFGCESDTLGETIYFVKDNGAGFDMSYADKLFKPFSRLHRDDEFEGFGIGLSSVSRIIKKHFGRIWADGKVGTGATFKFTLPISLQSKHQ